MTVPSGMTGYLRVHKGSPTPLCSMFFAFAEPGRVGCPGEFDELSPGPVVGPHPL